MATIQNEIRLTGGPEVQAQLAAIGVAGEAAATKLRAAFTGTSFGSGLVNSFAAMRTGFTAIVASASHTGEKFVETGRKIGEVGTAFAEVGRKAIELTAVVAGLEFGLGKLVQSSAETAEHIKQMSTALGISTHDFQGFAAVGNKVSLSSEQVTQGFLRMNKAFELVGQSAKSADHAVTEFKDVGVTVTDAMKTAETGTLSLDKNTGHLTRTYSELGITVHSQASSIKEVAKAQEQVNTDFGEGLTVSAKLLTSLKGLNITGSDFKQRLFSFADGISKISDAQARLTIETELFGRTSAPMWDAFFRGGSESIKVGVQLADTLHQILTPEEIEVGEKARIAFAVLETSIVAIKNHIGLALAPAFAQLAAGITAIISDNTEAITKFTEEVSARAIPIIKQLFESFKTGDISVLTDPLAKSIRDVVSDISSAGGVLRTMIGLFKDLLAAANALIAPFNAVFGTDFSAEVLFATAALLKFLGVFNLLSAAWAAGVAVFENAALILATTFSAGGVIAVGIGAIAGLIIALATRQTTAQRAATAHAQALAELRQAQAEVAAGIDGAVEKYDKLSRATLKAAEDVLTEAEAEVKAAIARDAAAGKVGDAFDQTAKQLSGGVSEAGRFRETVTGLQASLKNLGDAKANVKELKDEMAGGAAAARNFGASAASAGEAAVRSFTTADGKVVSVTNAMKAGAGAAKQTLGVVRSLGDEAKDSAAKLSSTAEAVQKIGDAAPDFEKTKQSAVDAWAEIQRTAAEAVEQIKQKFIGLGAEIDLAMQGVVGFVNGALLSLQTSVANVAAQVETAIANVIASLQSAVIEAQNLAAQAEAAAQAAQQAALAAQSAGGHAAGGFIVGPGTSTSDSILARLSNGEFVIKASAVSHWGVDFFRRLNSFQWPDGFALGGLVEGLNSSLSASLPRFAGGGAVATGSGGLSGRPINLTIGGETFRMAAPEDTVRNLVKFANRSSLLRIGKEPWWKGR